MAVKVFFYTLRPYDEQGIVEELAKQYGIEYGYTRCIPPWRTPSWPQAAMRYR